MDKLTKLYNSLPKKRIAAGVFLFNKKGELLLLKPTYKDHWSIPGGVIEENESPLAGAVRETREEIGLNLAKKKLKLVGIEYYGRRPDGLAEALQFLFLYGEIIKDEDVRISSKKLKMVTGGYKSEIGEYKFLKPEKVIFLLSEWSRPRIAACLKALKDQKSPIYLENGKEV